MKGKHMDKKEWLSRYPAMLAEAKEYYLSVRNLDDRNQIFHVFCPLLPKMAFPLK